jgi:hypothetical protein
MLRKCKIPLLFLFLIFKKPFGIFQVGFLDLIKDPRLVISVNLVDAG